MKFVTFPMIGLAMLGLSACDQMTSTQNSAAGAVGGAAAGLLLADAFDANDNWKVVGALAGAAAGTMVARNANGATCAYSNGNGTYYTAPCP
ncbi:glycine zipper 2TM domain-containing protein [Seohaeicola nanhaiensis]|uniref:17 kDa surface antigen n=1 Tax=Seohaeicola nanhaiensis TaxID=1387282 RepID=A0ABV9KER4_9RHOB